MENKIKEIEESIAKQKANYVSIKREYVEWLLQSITDKQREVDKWKLSEAVAVNLLNKYATELKEAREEIKGFKGFLRYASDIDKRMDALVETQQNEIERLRLNGGN